MAEAREAAVLGALGLSLGKCVEERRFSDAFALVETRSEGVCCLVRKLADSLASECYRRDEESGFCEARARRDAVVAAGALQFIARELRVHAGGCIGAFQGVLSLLLSIALCCDVPLLPALLVPLLPDLRSYLRSISGVADEACALSWPGFPDGCVSLARPLPSHLPLTAPTAGWK